MSTGRLEWDKAGEKLYSTGTKHGVLYVSSTTARKATIGGNATVITNYADGVAWNGLTGVTETPSGAEANDNYADDIKYISIRGAEKYNFTVEAFMAPDAWSECDGTRWLKSSILKVGQQTRKPFGMAFTSILGNDTNKDDFGFEIHLQYNATASPSERAYKTVGENPELITYSWECTADPVEVDSNHKPACNATITCTIGNGVLEVDSTTGNVKFKNGAVEALYNILFGTDASQQFESDSSTAAAASSPILPTIAILDSIVDETITQQNTVAAVVTKYTTLTAQADPQTP